MLSQPAVDPIISRLRPRSIQELLDHAFRLYRRYFFTFLAITAVVYVPVNMIVQLLNVAVQGNSVQLQRGTISDSSFDSSLNQSLTTLIVLSILLIGLGVLGGLLQYLSQGALTSAVADSHLDRPVSFGGAYRAMLQHIGPLLGAIGLQVLIGIGIFLPALVLFLMSLGTLATGGESGVGAGFTFICLTFLLFFVSFIFYAYIVVRLSVIVPSIMVESLGPVEGVRRSWQLVQGYWWRTLGLLVVLGIINFVISAGPAFLVTLLVGLFTGFLDPVLNAAVTAVVTIITEALYIPLELTCLTLYYFDLRVRKEGFDLETALSQRYGYPGGPANMGAAPGGYPAAAPGQYATPGGYAPPNLGYPNQSQAQPQPQYPTFTQPGYAQPETFSQPGGIDARVAGAGGAPTLPTLPTLPPSPLVESPGTSEVETRGPDTGSLQTPEPQAPEVEANEAPRAEGLGFSTPPISEQSAQRPGTDEPPPAGQS
ncbi:MAG TPA: hypothetical protein VND68_14590 [Chloroflexia bacterium]|jgi:hypothetical protein|nr:hypothetical protein [Chloroflexia bacterium]